MDAAALCKNQGGRLLKEVKKNDSEVKERNVGSAQERLNFSTT